MNQNEMFLDAIRHVAKLCAVAAMTGPKSGGQLFIKGATPFFEIVIVEDKATLKRLADWLREQGQRHKDPIWYRDADTAGKLDLVLFIGLAEWYPPTIRLRRVQPLGGRIDRCGLLSRPRGGD